MNLIHHLHGRLRLLEAVVIASAVIIGAVAGALLGGVR
jgi:hypothetical protein